MHASPEVVQNRSPAPTSRSRDDNEESGEAEPVWEDPYDDDEASSFSETGAGDHNNDHSDVCLDQYH